MSNTERYSEGADSAAQTLAGFRENRHQIRCVEILSSCCATCALDTDREFSLDAVPLLPHAHCTSPEGCQCRYIAVPVAAPAAGSGTPVIYPPLRDVTPAPTIPAHLKTPAAAMIAVGAVVIAFGISVINSSSGGKATIPELQSPSQMAPAMPARSSAAFAPVAPVAPVPTSRVGLAPARVAERPRLKQDREMDARAASDLRRAEAIARQNESALRAQEVAVQQQAYLKTLLSQQASSFGRAGASRTAESMVSASTAAVSN